MPRQETTYSKARENFASVIDQVLETGEPVIVRRRGHEPVAIVKASELAGLEETAHLLRSPKNAERLLKALRRAENDEGSVVTPEEIRKRYGLEDA